MEAQEDLVSCSDDSEYEWVMEGGKKKKRRKRTRPKRKSSKRKRSRSFLGKSKKKLPFNQNSYDSRLMALNARIAKDNEDRIQRAIEQSYSNRRHERSDKEGVRREYYNFLRPYTGIMHRAEAFAGMPKGAIKEILVALMHNGQIREEDIRKAFSSGFETAGKAALNGMDFIGRWFFPGWARRQESEEARAQGAPDPHDTRPPYGPENDPNPGTTEGGPEYGPHAGSEYGPENQTPKGHPRTWDYTRYDPWGNPLEDLRAHTTRRGAQNETTAEREERAKRTAEADGSVDFWEGPPLKVLQAQLNNTNVDLNAALDAAMNMTKPKSNFGGFAGPLATPGGKPQNATAGALVPGGMPFAYNDAQLTQYLTPVLCAAFGFAFGGAPGALVGYAKCGVNVFLIQSFLQDLHVPDDQARRLMGGDVDALRQFLSNIGTKFHQYVNAVAFRQQDQPDLNALENPEVRRLLDVKESLERMIEAKKAREAAAPPSVGGPPPKGWGERFGDFVAGAHRAVFNPFGAPERFFFPNAPQGQLQIGQGKKRRVMKGGAAASGPPPNQYDEMLHRLQVIQREITSPRASPAVLMAARAEMYAMAKYLSEGEEDETTAAAAGGPDVDRLITAATRAAAQQDSKPFGAALTGELGKDASAAPPSKEVANLRKEVDDLKAAMAQKEQQQDKQFTTRFQKEAHELNDRLTKEYAQAMASKDAMIAQLKEKFDKQEAMLKLKFAEFEAKLRKEIRELLARQAAGRASGVVVDDEIAEDMAALEERRRMEQETLQGHLREVAAARRASQEDIDVYLKKIKIEMEHSGKSIAAADEAVLAMAKQIDAVRDTAALNEAASMETMQAFSYMTLDDFLRKQEEAHKVVKEFGPFVTKDFIEKAEELAAKGLLNPLELQQLRRVYDLRMMAQGHAEFEIGFLENTAYPVSAPPNLDQLRDAASWPEANAKALAEAQALLVERSSEAYKQQIAAQYERFKRESAASASTPLYDFIKKMFQPSGSVPFNGVGASGDENMHPVPPEQQSGVPPEQPPPPQPVQPPPSTQPSQPPPPPPSTQPSSTQPSSTQPPAGAPTQTVPPPGSGLVPQPSGVAGATNASNITTPLIQFTSRDGRVMTEGVEATIPTAPPLAPGAQEATAARQATGAATGATGDAASTDNKTNPEDAKQKAALEEARRGFTAWTARASDPATWNTWRSKFEKDVDVWNTFKSMLNGQDVDGPPPVQHDSSGNEVVAKLPPSKDFKWRDLSYDGEYADIHPVGTWKPSTDTNVTIRIKGDIDAPTPEVSMTEGTTLSRDQYLHWVQKRYEAQGDNVIRGWADAGIFMQGNGADGVKGMYIGEEGAVMSKGQWDSYRQGHPQATGYSINTAKYGPPGSSGPKVSPTGNLPLGGKGQKRKAEKPHELDENEIAHHMAAYQRKGFRGVVAADEVHQMKPYAKGGAPVSFIMNTDKRSQGGRHWVAVHWQGSNLHYYDPFGKPPTADMKRRFTDLVASDGKNGTVQLKVNRVPNQRGNSVTCGLHSMRFLQDMHRGASFQQATNFNTKEGEAAARALMKGKDLPQFEYI